MGFSRQEHWSGLSFPSPVHESEKWKWSRFSRVRLLATPWTAAYQAPLPMGFSRQEYWSGVPLPSPTECWGPHRKCGIMDIQPTSPDLGLLMSSPRWLPLGSSNVLVHHCQLLAGKLIRGLSQQLHNPQIYSLDHTVLHSPPTPWFLSHFLLPLSLSLFLKSIGRLWKPFLQKLT